MSASRDGARAARPSSSTLWLPIVLLAGPEPVDDRHQRRQQEQRPDEAVRLEQQELPREGEQRDQRRMTKRIERRFGVVIGSLIMKNVNSRITPLLSWWISTASLWPRISMRATSNPA